MQTQKALMIEKDIQLELSIDLDNEDDEETVQRLLSSFPLEVVALQTLSKAGIKLPIQMTLLITTDEIIRFLNKQYRNQDKATDILSFPLLEKPMVHAPTDQLWIPTDTQNGEKTQTKQAFVTPPSSVIHLGDIVISWPTVMRQATDIGHVPAYEILFLLSHGVLHLIGYDDQNEAGYQAMMCIQLAVMEATQQNTWLS